MIYNTMRFGTDSFNAFLRQALLIRASGHGWDFRDYNRLDNFIIDGNEPSGTKRRFMFKVEGKIYTFNGNDLVEYTDDVTVDNVLADGNTAAQLLAVNKSTTALVGHVIYPIIALYTENQNVPSVKLGVKLSNILENLDFTKDDFPNINFQSSIVDDNPKSQILDFDVIKTVTGNADVTLTVKLKNEDNTWTDYMSLDAAKGKIAYGAKFQALYHVDAVNGTNSVKLDRARVYFSPDLEFNTYGDDAWIYSTVNNYQLKLKNCIVVVKHPELNGSTLTAEVSYQKTRWNRNNILLGTGNGSEQSFTLDYDIFPHTLTVFVNGVATTDYTFDTSTKAITLTAPNGQNVTASFKINREDEVWLPMTADPAQPTNNGYWTTRFELPNPDEVEPWLTVAGIRFKLTRGIGTEEYTKTATGAAQTLTFKHEPYEITCNATTYDFDSLTNTLTFTATKNSTVNINAKWRNDTPYINSFAVAYAT